MANCYIHIPFCNSKCKYCRFASFGKIGNLHIQKYVSFLCDEIKNSTFLEHKLNTLYFGGGTPSVLDKISLIKIFKELKNKFSFSRNIEITIETTPDNINKSSLILWKKLGINRVSIGIQTLNDYSLRYLNRNTKKIVLNSLELLKKFNFIDNISLDFIIGLPFVGRGEILENIKFILDNYSFVKHISVYMLEDYYNSSKVLESKFDNIVYPKIWKDLGLKEEEFLKEYADVKEFLLKSGFKNYEISNFGKNNYKCLHNIGYWNFEEVYAFGLSAYGLYKDSFGNYYRYANSESFKEYYIGKKIFNEKLSKQNIFLEKLMFGLRTNGLEENFYQKLNQEKIRFFIDSGFLLLKNNKLILKNSGVLVLDYILGEIL